MNIKTSLPTGRNRSNKAIAEEEKFTKTLPLLFDILRSDAKEHLTEEDFLFLVRSTRIKDQSRKFTFEGKDEVLEKPVSLKPSLKEVLGRMNKKQLH